MKAWFDPPRADERGIAMVTAILAALIVSITATVVLNMTFRRFELSAFRTDHSVAGLEAEAGLQYAFFRLAQDATFRLAVQDKRSVLGAGRPIPADDPRAEYVLSCNPAVNPDAQVTGLHMGGTVGSSAVDGTGGKHVTVRIRFFNAADITAGFAPISARPYRVRASADYGTGGP